MGEGVDLALYFGANLVGTVSDTYYSEYNWYGAFQPAEEMPPRIREFIALCRDWHARVSAGGLPDAAEFDAWRDVHDPGEWRTLGPGGASRRIGAPVFWPGGWICWREAKEVEPVVAPDSSRE